MKIIGAFLLLFNFAFAFEKTPTRGDFQVFQTDPFTDLSPLKAPKRFLKDVGTRPLFITTAFRDSFLFKHLGEKIENMDDLDRDLLLRRLTHYSPEQFLLKYQGILKRPKYEAMKREMEQSL